jgi:hypothetical protein
LTCCSSAPVAVLGKISRLGSWRSESFLQSMLGRGLLLFYFPFSKLAAMTKQSNILKSFINQQNVKTRPNKTVTSTLVSNLLNPQIGHLSS